MGIKLVRFLFLLSCVVIGYQMSMGVGISPRVQFMGGIIGLLAALLILSIEWSLRKLPAKGLISGSLGLLMGLILAHFISQTILTYPFDTRIALFLRVGISLSLGYLGMVVAWRKREEFRFFFPHLDIIRSEHKKKILDTSVIIDGRIADIAESGFIEGSLVIPKFVLQEVQKIADSPDPLKRARGRRGLDILARIQKNSSIEVIIEDKDYPDIKEVDAKLIQLAKDLPGKIVTNDYNLNKVAKLQNVDVLNINELANAVKPVILPNEIIKVKIVKEGKEPRQGIAYLDDGTMVVVDDARYHLGEEIEVGVTSVLQTSSGRMIFGKITSTTSTKRGRK